MLKPEIYLVLIISVITLFNESYAKGGKGGMNTGVRIYNIILNTVDILMTLLIH